jgi:hypothetical protein
MAITPTQFAKKTAQCEPSPSVSELTYLQLLTSRDSRQLGGGEATSDLLLPRMDPSCTSQTAIECHQSSTFFVS